MQTIQLLAARPSARRSCARARAHLAPGGLLAMRDRRRARGLRRARRRAAAARHPRARRLRLREPPRVRLVDDGDRIAIERAARSSTPRGSTHRRADVVGLERVDGRRSSRREAARARLRACCRAAARRRRPTSTSARRGDARCAERRRTLRVCALYPDLMNIYADRGNLLLLERRCAWRGIGFELAAAGLGDASIPTRTTSSTSAADRTATSGCAPRTWSRPSARRCTRPPRAARRSWRVRRLPAARPRLRARRRDDPGRGPAGPAHRARSDGARLIGNVAIEVEPAGAAGAAGARGLREPRRPHAPRRRRAAARPRAARATATTGARASRARAAGQRDRHLSARPAAAEERLVRRLADRARALGLDEPLAPLDDALEDAAHAGARRAAGV